MISDLDVSKCTLHLLAWQALRAYTVDALLSLIDDEDPLVRTAAARELHARGGAQVFEVAISRCDDQRADAREIAAFILGQLGTPDRPFRSESIPRLANLVLCDLSPDVRAAAVAALGHLYAAEAKEVLLGAARDPSSDVRANAAVSLGRLGALPDVLRALEVLLNDDSSEVREWAELGLDIANELG